VGFYDQISKKRVREHCNENGLSSTFFFPAVTRKLRHVAGDKSLVNPYQKPQRLINRFLDLFSNIDDWILDLFSGTGIVILILLFVFGLLLIVL
jgi:DNA modification methylase